MGAETWRRWAWGLLLAAILLYSLVHFAYSGIYAALRVEGADFRSIFPGKLMFGAVERWPRLAKEWIIITSYIPSTVIWNYGPVPHFLTLPFVFVSTKAQALTIILGINLVFTFISACLWTRMVGGDRLRPLLIGGIACVWLNYFPLLEALAGREIEVLELFLITVAMWALRRQRQTLAGVGIGVAAMTKFLPAIFIPYLLIKRFHRAFWVAVITTLLLGGLGQWLLGFEHSVTLSLLREETGGQIHQVSAPHQALASVLYKMFTHFDPQQRHPVILYHEILRPLGMILQAALLLVCGGFLWRWRQSRLLELETALLAIVMVLAAPHANTYYLVFVLPALSVGVASWVQQPQAFTPVLKAAFIGAIVLSGLLVPMQVLGWMTGLSGDTVAQVIQLYSLPAVGMMLAAITMVGLHQSVRQVHGCAS